MSILSLKVKLVSLGMESRYIRKQELRQAKRLKKALARGNNQGATVAEGNVCSLAEHRRNVVRKAAREAHLAHGYLRGVPYRDMENFVRPGNEPDWKQVAKVVRSHGSGLGNFTEDSMKDWISY